MIVTTIFTTLLVRSDVAEITWSGTAEAGGHFVAGIDKTGNAWGRIDRTGNVTGWNVLDIETAMKPTGEPSSGDPRDAYYAAGQVEAALTCDEIGLFSRNNDDSRQDDTVSDFTKASYQYVLGMSSAQHAPGNVSDYWSAVRNVLGQFKGVVDGYNTYCKAHSDSYNPLTEAQMFLMQADGDLEDLQAALYSQQQQQHQQTPSTLRRSYVNPQQQEQQQEQQDQEQQVADPAKISADGLRCSMLMKLAPDASDIWFGHATWDSFSNMAPRLYKTYSLPVQRNGEWAVHTVGFSSSPSWLSSIDDWYMTANTSDLAVIETSHGINNKALYKKLTPDSVLCWIRTIVANTLATDGASWAETFSYNHSGTYNNEWQVIDLNKFTVGKQPTKDDGLLTILEEIPGQIHWEDMTDTLGKEGFWPSFNVPYFSDIQRAAGYTPSDWTDDDRHCLFTQLQESVVDMDTMERVMRHNDFKHDKCSHHNACTGAIACRADLGVVGKQMFGALDAKWSSYTHGYKTLKTQANAGPTHDTQPVFCWSPASKDPHYGHPTCFNFTTTEMVPHQFA